MHEVQLLLRSAVIAWLVACQPTDPPAHRAPPPKPADFVDADGIALEFRSDATIHLTGIDRWGAPIDTTYESIAFLRAALPTLDRSLTPAQMARVRHELAPR
jgi:hypothetical protein